MVASNSILETLTIVFQGLFGVFNMPADLPMNHQELIPPAGYTCSEPKWVKRPQPKGAGVYLASMSADCVVYPELGGDFEKLQAYSIEQIRKQATIDRGPIDTTFEGLPSKYLDVTVQITGKNATTIKQDVNLATDIKTKFVSSTVSRRITGTGNGAYLKKLDSRVDAFKTAVPTEDKVTVTFYSEVEKPWYAPEGVFLGEIEKRVPGEFAKLRDKVVGEMSANY